MHKHSGKHETESSMEATDAVVTVFSFYISYTSLFQTQHRLNGCKTAFMLL